jgi:hypothetical protein
MSLLRKCDRCGEMAEAGAGLECEEFPKGWAEVLVLSGHQRGTASMVEDRIEVCPTCRAVIAAFIRAKDGSGGTWTGR